MLILLLIRRLSPRTRVIVGAVVIAAGAVLTAVAVAAVHALLIHGIILMAVGAVVAASARIRGSQTRRA